MGAVWCWFLQQGLRSYRMWHLAAGWLLSIVTHRSGHPGGWCGGGSCNPAALGEGVYSTTTAIIPGTSSIYINMLLQSLTLGGLVCGAARRVAGCMSCR